MTRINSDNAKKYLVAYKNMGDHGEDEGFDYIAIYDKESDAYDYLQHSPSFRCLEVIELPYNLAIPKTLYAKRGVCVRYNMLTREALCYQPSYYGLEEFEKPKCVRHNYFPLHEVNCILDVNEDNQINKAIAIITLNQNDLMDSMAEVFSRAIGNFESDGLIKVKVDYQALKVFVQLQQLDTPRFEALVFPCPSDYVFISDAYKKYSLAKQNKTTTVNDLLKIFEEIKVRLTSK